MARFSIECPACPKLIVLPNRSPEGKLLNQPYWPIGEESLWLLCPDCGIVFAHSRGEIHQEAFTSTAPSQPTSTFWRLTLQCVHEDCGKQVSLHATSARDATKVDAGRILADKWHAVRCPAGHPRLTPVRYELIGHAE
jgi:hypothetical protein